MAVLRERLRPSAAHHPNSARYCLDRWKELTGRDIETVDGLNASVIALELSR
jgi:DNA-binding PucR family transcriptional regulator